MPDRWLRALAPVVAREAREDPATVWDEILEALSEAATRRGLRSVLAEMVRVSEGGDPLPADAPKPDEPAG